jgi:hypothetical protein
MADDEDYLFADPQPQWVPADWFDFLKRAVVVEDPDFVPPWIEDD